MRAFATGFPSARRVGAAGAAGPAGHRRGGPHTAGTAAGLVALAALGLAGCAPALNFLASRDGVEITRAIAYGDGARRTLDLYRPAAAAAAPIVVFFYGGSWQGGAKEIYRFVGAALAQRGLVVVIPDYRVYPPTRYPGFLDDGALALRWVKDHAARFGGDQNRLFVMGHSAGAYIAAMLALDGRRLRGVGLSAERDIAGLIGMSGPYDFLPLTSERLRTIFGGPDDPSTQPITYVASGAPPALLMTGTRDRTVDPENSVRLAARLRAAGDDATLVAYPWVGHLGIIGAFARPLRFLAPVLRDVTAFIAAAPQRPAARPPAGP